MSLTHTVLSVRDLQASVRFYQHTLGMRVSDFLFLAPEDTVPFQVFMRFDRGPDPSDHHSLALLAGPMLGHVHSAFEVPDLDAVVTGGQYLKKTGWKRSWGIGRHLLGSNLFDYWRDDVGDLFEHSADIDQFDHHMHAGYHLMHRDAHHQWGPDITADFLGSKPSWANFRAIGGRLLFDREFTLRRLRAIAAAAGRRLD